LSTPDRPFTELNHTPPLVSRSQSPYTRSNHSLRHSRSSKSRRSTRSSWPTPPVSCTHSGCEVGEYQTEQVQTICRGASTPGTHRASSSHTGDMWATQACYTTFPTPATALSRAGACGREPFLTLPLALKVSNSRRPLTAHPHFPSRELQTPTGPLTDSHACLRAWPFAQWPARTPAQPSPLALLVNFAPSRFGLTALPRHPHSQTSHTMPSLTPRKAHQAQQAHRSHFTKTT
jgi:hypothetical protein